MVNKANVQCRVCLFSPVSLCLHSVAPARQQTTNTGTCTGSTKGQACNNRALPFTQHCFQRILSTMSLILQLLATSADEWPLFYFLFCARFWNHILWWSAMVTRHASVLLCFFLHCSPQTFCWIVPSSSLLVAQPNLQMVSSAPSQCLTSRTRHHSVKSMPKKWWVQHLKAKYRFFLTVLQLRMWCLLRETASLSLPKGHTVHLPALVKLTD